MRRQGRGALALGVMVMAALPTAPAGQRLDLDDVVARLGQYIVEYESRLATVVAEEVYIQTASTAQGRRTRTLRSDYALTLASDRQAWVGFRDTFEVDGKAVRDRDGRLQDLLASGAVGQAARIAAESSRYNLAGDVVTRNVNVPTLALEMLHPRHRSRFSFRRAGEETSGDRRGWLVEFRERERPTLVRRPDGRDNPMRGVVVVDPRTGEVLRTSLSWTQVPGAIAVRYGRVDGIDLPVPLAMTETFTRGAATVGGDAVYSNHRRFVTTGRLLTR